MKKYNTLNKRFHKKKKPKKKFISLAAYRENKRIEAKKKKAPKSIGYLSFKKKLKQGIFLKKPSFNEIKYPFHLNLKLINEYIKKK